jgi:hypothetical protein
MSIQDKIEEIKKKGYELDFGTVFNLAFENYKRIALYAGSLLLLFFAIIIGILIVSMGLKAFFDMFKPENIIALSKNFDFIIINLVSSILFTSLTSPFFAGLLKMVRCAKLDEEFHFSTVFEFYKSPYLQNLVGATFLISSCSTLLSYALEYLGNPLLGFVISIVISGFTLLTIPLIIFGDMKAINAIKSSVLIVAKQPLVILGLMILAALLSFVGFIGCVVGVFFTVPFVYAMYYTIYESIIGFE